MCQRRGWPLSALGTHGAASPHRPPAPHPVVPKTGRGYVPQGGGAGAQCPGAALEPGEVESRPPFMVSGMGVVSCLSFSSVPLSLPRLPLPVAEGLSRLLLSLLWSW